MKREKNVERYYFQEMRVSTALLMNTSSALPVEVYISIIALNCIINKILSE